MRHETLLSFTRRFGFLGIHHMCVTARHTEPAGWREFWAAIQHSRPFSTRLFVLAASDSQSDPGEMPQVAHLKDHGAKKTL